MPGGAISQYLSTTHGPATSWRHSRVADIDLWDLRILWHQQANPVPGPRFRVRTRAIGILADALALVPSPLIARITAFTRRTPYPHFHRTPPHWFHCSVTSRASRWTNRSGLSQVALLSRLQPDVIACTRRWVFYRRSTYLYLRCFHIVQCEKEHKVVVHQQRTTRPGYKQSSICPKIGGHDLWL
jgi:hypothetical protein